MHTKQHCRLIPKDAQTFRIRGARASADRLSSTLARRRGSAASTAETDEPAQQKEYTERDGEDVPAAQTIIDCVKGIGHGDEQPDEH